jgi:hypothetical protein
MKEAKPGLSEVFLGKPMVFLSLPSSTLNDKSQISKRETAKTVTKQEVTTTDCSVPNPYLVLLSST